MESRFMAALMALALLAAAAAAAAAGLTPRADHDCDASLTVIDDPANATDFAASCPEWRHFLTLQPDSAWDGKVVVLDGPSMPGICDVKFQFDGELNLYSSTFFRVSSMTLSIDDRADFKAVRSINVSFPRVNGMDIFNYAVGFVEPPVLDFGPAFIWSFRVERVQQGSTFGEFLSLGSVRSSLTVVDNRFEALRFGATVSHIKRLLIYDNLGLGTVALPDTALAHVQIHNNSGLEEVELGSESFRSIWVDATAGLRLTKLTSLEIGCDDLDQTDECGFGGERVSFQNLTSFAAPELRTVGGESGLYFVSNRFDFLELPVLKNIPTWLIVRDNAQLETLSLPALDQIGNLEIFDNDGLRNVTANNFTRAARVTMSGNFTNVEFFSLTAVAGNFTLAGAESMDCSWFDEVLQPVVRGEYSCVGNHTKPAGGWKPSTFTGAVEDEDEDGDEEEGEGEGGGAGDQVSDRGRGGSSGLSAGEKAGIGVGVAAVLIAALLGLFLFCVRAGWKGNKMFVERRRGASERFEKPELHDTQVYGPALLSDSQADMRATVLGHAELDANDTARHEMPARVVVRRKEVGSAKPQRSAGGEDGRPAQRIARKEVGSSRLQQGAGERGGNGFASCNMAGHSEII